MIEYAMFGSISRSPDFRPHALPTSRSHRCDLAKPSPSGWGTYGTARLLFERAQMRG